MPEPHPMKKKTVSFSKNSRNIFFHILTQCNLSCRHCYINPDQHGRKMLPLATILAWLEALSENAASSNVIFLGGEPTLHPDLHLAVKQTKQMGFQSITIDTNGYLFNNVLSKMTPEDVNYISFSLDGATRKTNDSIRGKGSYDACISGIKQTINNGFNTSLIYTVSGLNYKELTMMPPLLNHLGIDHFFIQVIGLRGNVINEKISGKNLQLSHSMWLDLVPSVAESAARSGITVTYPKVYLDKEAPFACAGRVADNYFIFPNGRVYRCPLCEDFPIHSLEFSNNRLMPTQKINEQDLFNLNIPEGCVMNRLVQPENIIYTDADTPVYKIACCLLKEEVQPDNL